MRKLRLLLLALPAALLLAPVAFAQTTKCVFDYKPKTDEEAQIVKAELDWCEERSIAMPQDLPPFLPTT